MEHLQIVCPHCIATNRLLKSRLKDAPVCGRCKKLLFQQQPMVLTSANMASILNNNDIPILIDCWASWCGPCRQFAPVFEQAAKVLEPQWRLAKLDTEAEQTVASKFAIRSIPTLIVYKGGKEVARQSGAMSLTQLQHWVATISLKIH